MPRNERPRSPEVGAWLQRRREFLGLTQEQLVEAIGLLSEQASGKSRAKAGSVRAIVDYEAGYTKNLRYGWQLAAALQLPPELHAAFVRWVAQQPSDPPWQPPPPHTDFQAQPGPTLVGQATARSAAVPNEQPASNPASAYIGAIPQHAPLTVREQLAGELRRLLGTQRVLILTGMLGLGKTLLATAIARNERRRSRVCWLTLGPNAQLVGMLEQIAAFCAAQRVPGPLALFRRWRQHDDFAQLTMLIEKEILHALYRFPTLLCFDNVEQVAEDRQIMAFLGQLVQQALARRGANDLRVLIIARARLTPMLPTELHFTLPRLTEQEMRRWLQVHASALEEQYYAELGRIAEGVPGLLRLAAQVLTHVPDRAQALEQIASAGNTEELLHQMLYEYLTPAERTVMSALAILGEHSTRSAIEATAQIAETMPTLLRLVRQHLIEEQRSGTQRTFQQHTIYREYYRHLLDAPAYQDMHRRAAQHFVRLDSLRAAQHYAQAQEYARAAEQIQPRVWAIVQRGGARMLLDVLEQIMDHQPDARAGVELRIIAGETAGLIGAADQSRRHFQAALDQLEATPALSDQRLLRIRVCRGMGQLLESAKPHEALAWLQRGLAYAAGQAPLEEALLQLRIGAAWIAAGESAAAQRALEVSLALLPNTADAEWRARILINLGVIACTEGASERGIAYYRDALAAVQPPEHQAAPPSEYLWVLASIEHNLAIEQQIAGQWVAADESYRRALQHAEQLGSVAHRTEIQSSLALLRMNQGSYREAQRLLEACREVAEQCDLDEQLAHIHANLADLFIRQGFFTPAATHIREADILIQAGAFEYLRPEVLSYRALIANDTGDSVQALDLARQAVAEARADGYRRDLGIGLRVLGTIYAHQADPQQAQVCFAESVDILAALDRYEAARTQLAWGRMCQQHGDGARASTLVQAAQRIFADLGITAEL